ncbi:hypothetical protein ACET3Z_006033 [Daucus carota]
MERVATRKKIKLEQVNSLRHTRDRYEQLADPLHYIYSDPPSIAGQLSFTVYDQKDKLEALIREIDNGFENGHIKEDHIEDVADCTKELGEMIATDPRIGDLLGVNFLNRIVHLLKCEKSPNLQVYAASILESIVAFSCNKDEVDAIIQSITPVVLRLICSPVTGVQVKALWLFRTLVFKISKSSVEEALAPITSIILEDSIGFGVLHPASEVLLDVCQVHPKLSHEKLKLVLPALVKLIESKILPSFTAGCWGLAYLCEGREEMVVEEKDLKRLIRRFVNLMNSEKHPVIISGLIPLGSIARWGDDDVIEAIIKDKGSLRILSILLEEGDMYMMKQICWIISNITARKGKHIRAVIYGATDCKLIDPLLNIVRDCKLHDVRKEALWALSNAMCGVERDQIVCLRETCLDFFCGELLLPFQRDIPFVLVIIQGLVNINALSVCWDGHVIDGIELYYIFMDILHNGDFCSLDDSVQKSDTSYSLLCYPLRGLPFGIVYSNQELSVRLHGY